MKFKILAATLTVVFSLVSNNSLASVIGTWSENGGNLILDLEGQIDSDGLSLSFPNYTQDYISHRHNGYSEFIMSPNSLSNTWNVFNISGDWSLVDSTDTSLDFRLFDNQSYSGVTLVAFMMGFDSASGSGYLGLDSRFLGGVSNYDQQIQWDGFFTTSLTSISSFNDFTLSRNGSSLSVFEVASSDVPEPSTLTILAVGMFGLASRRFKKNA